MRSIRNSKKWFEPFNGELNPFNLLNWISISFVAKSIKAKYQSDQLKIALKISL